MAELPRDKKLVRVEYTYADGSKYYLDEQNSQNYDSNMNMAAGILATRSYLKFAPIEWQDAKENKKCEKEN